MKTLSKKSAAKFTFTKKQSGFGVAKYDWAVMLDGQCHYLPFLGARPEEEGAEQTAYDEALASAKAAGETVVTSKFSTFAAVAKNSAYPKGLYFDLNKVEAAQLRDIGADVAEDDNREYVVVQAREPNDEEKERMDKHIETRKKAVAGWKAKKNGKAEENGDEAAAE